MPYETAVHASAHDHHHRRGAVIGPLAAVLADPAAEFRERHDERVLEQSLIAQVVVERDQPVVQCRP